MASRNEFTGDEMRTKATSDEYRKNIERIFPEAKVQRGRYRQCRETGDMLPIHEWLDKYGEPEKPRTPFIIGDIEPYTSPIDGRVISSRKQRMEDLKRSGCRPYEGLEQEQKVADRVRAEKDKEFESKVDGMIEKTRIQLRDKITEPVDHINPAWMFDDN